MGNDRWELFYIQGMWSRHLDKCHPFTSLLELPSHEPCCTKLDTKPVKISVEDVNTCLKASRGKIRMRHALQLPSNQQQEQQAGHILITLVTHALLLCMFNLSVNGVLWRSGTPRTDAVMMSACKEAGLLYLSVYHQCVSMQFNQRLNSSFGEMAWRAVVFIMPYCVLSQRTSKSEQVLLSYENICFTL